MDRFWDLPMVTLRLFYKVEGGGWYGMGWGGLGQLKLSNFMEKVAWVNVVYLQVFLWKKGKNNNTG